LDVIHVVSRLITKFQDPSFPLKGEILPKRATGDFNERGQPLYRKPKVTLLPNDSYDCPENMQRLNSVMRDKVTEPTNNAYYERKRDQKER